MDELFWLDLERTFDMEHACGCDKWCDCYARFKKKWKRVID